MKTAHLTESFGVDVEFHVGGPAHLHCMSVIRNTNYFGHGLLHPEVDWMTNAGFETEVEAIDDGGSIPVPDGEGLGVEIDWDLVGARQTGHTLIDEASAGGSA